MADEGCLACGRSIPFLFPGGVGRFVRDEERQLRLSNPVLRDAFRDNGDASLRPPPPAVRLADGGLTPLDGSGTAIVRETAQIYRRGAPNCVAVGVASGVRGGVIGAAFGGVMGASNAVQSGYRGSAAVTHAGYSAIRNAAGFAAWTAVFSSSRCALVRVRRRDDIVNSAAAGAFTGGVLTLASVRGHWRYNAQLIATNAGGSALVAVVFGALGGMY